MIELRERDVDWCRALQVLDPREQTKVLRAFNEARDRGFPGFEKPCFRISVRFEWRDLWWGAYVDKKPREHRRRLYVCLIPTLPIVIQWYAKGTQRDPDKTLDPVHYFEGDGLLPAGWYFWDETWAHRHGPFMGQGIARTQCTIYAETML